MTEKINQKFPENYSKIDNATKASGFTMASDVLTCTLLKTLAASKPSGKFLELGTGTGLATSWILDGMDADSTLVSFDNDEQLLEIARQYLGDDARLNLVLSDGEAWVKNNIAEKYDYIFADTWHGKFLLLEDVLNTLNKGGLYIIDDMLPESDWPEEHYPKVDHLVKYLESRDDLTLVKQNWATGIIIVVKK